MDSEVFILQKYPKKEEIQKENYVKEKIEELRP